MHTDLYIVLYVCLYKTFFNEQVSPGKQKHLFAVFFSEQTFTLLILTIGAS